MLSRRTWRPTGSTPTFEPACLTACLVTSTRAPGGAERTVIRAVIIFVRLAMRSRLHAFRCHSTRPLARLNSRPARGGGRPPEGPGSPWGSPGAGGGEGGGAAPSPGWGGPGGGSRGRRGRVRGGRDGGPVGGGRRGACPQEPGGGGGDPRRGDPGRPP